MPSMGEVRSVVGVGVGRTCVGVGASGTESVGDTEGVSVGEAGTGVAGGVAGVGWQAALRRVKASRQVKRRGVIDILCLADEI